MTRLGRYTLLRRVGIGGMAEVWKAKAQGPAGFEKVVAVKTILPQLLGDLEFIDMFVEEAKLVARLVHPNIVQVYDFGVSEAEGGRSDYYITMEYVAGQNLATIASRLRERGDPLPLDVSLLVGIETAKALGFAHAGKDPEGQPLAIVHRDVSPHNVLISYAGQVKVTDFGIAKVETALPRTGAGVWKGKLPYMSPEQVKLLPLDPTTDVFSLGVVLFEMVTGNRLFPGRTAEDLNRQVTSYTGVSADRLADLPPEVRTVLTTSLQVVPADRYPDATHMLAALEEALGQNRIADARDSLTKLMTEVFETERTEENLEESNDPDSHVLHHTRSWMEAVREAEEAEHAEKTAISPPDHRDLARDAGEDIGASTRISSTQVSARPEGLESDELSDPGEPLDISEGEDVEEEATTDHEIAAVLASLTPTKTDVREAIKEVPAAMARPLLGEDERRDEVPPEESSIARIPPPPDDAVQAEAPVEHTPSVPGVEEDIEDAATPDEPLFPESAHPTPPSPRRFWVVVTTTAIVSLLAGLLTPQILPRVLERRSAARPTPTTQIGTVPPQDTPSASTATESPAGTDGASSATPDASASAAPSQTPTALALAPTGVATSTSAAPAPSWVPDDPTPTPVQTRAVVRPTGTPAPTKVATPRRTPRPTPRHTAVIHTPTPAPTPPPSQDVGYLTIRARPWVQVWIDGKKVADETPLRRHAVSAGKHWLRFINPDLELRMDETVQVPAGGDLALFVDLKKGSVERR